MKKLFLLLFALMLLVVFVSSCAQEKKEEPKKAEAPAAAAGADAKEVFKAKCAACHKIGGAGGSVGPDLSKVGGAKDKEWLKKWLKDPKAVKADSKMMKVDLTDAELDALAGYLAGLK